MGFLLHCHLSPLICNKLHILVDTSSSSYFPIQIQEPLISPRLVYNILEYKFFSIYNKSFLTFFPLNSALIFLSVNMNS